MNDLSTSDQMLMAHTPTLGKYAEALCGAQTELTSPKFDSKNPHYKSRYASLASCIKTIRPVLNKHGIALSMMPLSSDGHVGCVTQFTHTSGEWMRCRLLFVPAKNDIHGQAAAVTYAKRYTLCGMAGVEADDDDDGNAALPKFDPAKAAGSPTEASAGELLKFTNMVEDWSADDLSPSEMASARRLVLRQANDPSGHITRGYRPTKTETAVAIGWINKQREEFPTLQDVISQKAIERDA